MAEAEADAFDLKLDATDLVSFEKAFVAFADRVGLPGAAIHDGLKRGRPLHETLGLSSGDLDVIYGLGHRHLAAGHVDKALKLFGALTLFAPDRAEAWFGLVLAERADGRAERARACLDVVERLRPAWAPACFQRLEMAVESGDWAAADAASAAFRAADASGVTAYMNRRAELIAAALAAKTGNPR